MSDFDALFSRWVSGGVPVSCAANVCEGGCVAEHGFHIRHAGGILVGYTVDVCEGDCTIEHIAHIRHGRGIPVGCTVDVYQGRYMTEQIRRIRIQRYDIGISIVVDVAERTGLILFDVPHVDGSFGLRCRDDVGVGKAIFLSVRADYSSNMLIRRTNGWLIRPCKSLHGCIYFSTKLKHGGYDGNFGAF